MKLLIGVPSTDFMHAEFVKSLYALTARLTREEVRHDLMIEAGTLVYFARDAIACRAINEQYTHVLWLDSDMVFGDGIYDDLRFCGKDFASGIAVSRRKPFSSCLFRNIEPGKIERYGDAETLPKEAFEVAGCGFACVLTATEILEAVMMKEKTCFTPLKGYGEDVAFCARARNLGYHIFAEPAVRLGHIGHLPVWPDDVARYRDDWYEREGAKT